MPNSRSVRLLIALVATAGLTPGCERADAFYAEDVDGHFRFELISQARHSPEQEAHRQAWFLTDTDVAVTAHAIPESDARMRGRTLATVFEAVQEQYRLVLGAETREVPCEVAGGAARCLRAKFSHADRETVRHTVVMQDGEQFLVLDVTGPAEDLVQTQRQYDLLTASLTSAR